MGSSFDPSQQLINNNVKEKSQNLLQDMEHLINKSNSNISSFYEYSTYRIKKEKEAVIKKSDFKSDRYRID